MMEDDYGHETYSGGGAMSVDLLAFIGDDKNIVTYRPSWNAFTGSINATIFLQQVVYWWIRSGRQPFYKFAAPCQNSNYRAGDSWQEELGMSRRELETVQKKIVVKTKGGLDEAGIISTWRDRFHRTWYALNEVALVAELERVYPSPPDAAVGMQGGLPLSPVDGADGGMRHRDGEPMAESCNGTNGGMRHQNECTNAPLANGGMRHQPMAHLCGGNNRDHTENNNRNQQQRPTAGEMAGVATAPASASPPRLYSTEAILGNLGIVGKPLRELAGGGAEVALAWSWQCELEGMEQRYRPGLVVNSLRAGTQPPRHLLELAGAWVGMDESDREVLRGFVARHQRGMGVFADEVPEGFFRDLYDDSLNAFWELYQREAYLTRGGDY